MHSARSPRLDPPQEAFDRLTRLACRTIRTPASMLTYIGAEQQLIKSSLGLPEPWVSGARVPASHSLCRYVVAFGKPVLIQDTGEYRRLRQNPVVRATNSRSYLGVPLRSEQGEVVGALCAIDRVPRAWDAVDVEALQDLAAVAGGEIANEALRRNEGSLLHARAQEVLAAVSHDLRSLVGVIDGSAALLLDTGGTRRARDVEELERIRRSARHMTVMIRDLLDASKIDAGCFRVRPSPRPVADLVADARAILQPLADAKGIALTYESAESLGSVCADPDQILRVFSNLIGNAIKFCPPNGAIRVRCRRADGEDEAVISVSDTGPGIAPEHLERVFDRHWQGIHGDGRGAGLGLAIARGIVEAHGGRIWVESTPGGGATFSFALPLVHAPAVAA